VGFDRVEDLEEALPPSCIGATPSPTRRRSWPGRTSLRISGEEAAARLRFPTSTSAPTQRSPGTSSWPGMPGATGPTFRGSASSRL